MLIMWLSSRVASRVTPELCWLCGCPPALVMWLSSGVMSSGVGYVAVLRSLSGVFRSLFLRG